MHSIIIYIQESGEPDCCNALLIILKKDCKKTSRTRNLWRVWVCPTAQAMQIIYDKQPSIPEVSHLIHKGPVWVFVPAKQKPHLFKAKLNWINSWNQVWLYTIIKPLLDILPILLGRASSQDQQECVVEGLHVPGCSHKTIQSSSSSSSVSAWKPSVSMASAWNVYSKLHLKRSSHLFGFSIY